MKRLAPSLLLLILTAVLYGQTVSITYDYELNRFTENELLPSESSFLINGTAPESIRFIEVNIYHAEGKDDRSPLATGVWKHPYNRTGNNFYVPINYQLHAGKTYDLRISYFRPVEEEERRQIYRQLATYIQAYIAQSFRIKNDKIRLLNSARQTFKELNELMVDGLHRYRGTTEPLFTGFSDIIRLKLEQLDGRRLEEIVHSTSPPDSMEITAGLSPLPAGLSELREFITSEVKFALNKDMAVLADQRYIDNYETESRKGYFGLNAGYGAIFFGGDIDDPNYDSGLYLGLGFPLATSRIAPKFLRNASLGFGVFVQNMEDQEGNTISGPVIERPFYVGLDYKLFSFVNLNLGAAFIERQSNGMDGNTAILVRPFLGVSGKVNISLSFAK